MRVACDNDDSPDPTADSPLMMAVRVGCMETFSLVVDPRPSRWLRWGETRTPGLVDVSCKAVQLGGTAASCKVRHGVLEAGRSRSGRCRQDARRRKVAPTA